MGAPRFPPPLHETVPRNNHLPPRTMFTATAVQKPISTLPPPSERLFSPSTHRDPNPLDSGFASGGWGTTELRRLSWRNSRCFWLHTAPGPKSSRWPGKSVYCNPGGGLWGCVPRMDVGDAFFLVGRSSFPSSEENNDQRMPQRRLLLGGNWSTSSWVDDLLPC